MSNIRKSQQKILSCITCLVNLGTIYALAIYDNSLLPLRKYTVYGIDFSLTILYTVFIVVFQILR